MYFLTNNTMDGDWYFLILVLGILPLLLYNPTPKPKKSKSKCSIHRWVYKKQPESDVEYMQCDECGFFPNSYTDDNNGTQL